MSGPKYGYPYNNPKNYIFPETPLEENTDQDSPLTSVTNSENAKDLYNWETTANGKNSSYGTGQTQDKLALGSELEPSTFENPLAGGFYVSGPIYCETCNSSVSPEDLSLPRHLGHNLRNGDQSVDVDQTAKYGGGYRIEAMHSESPTNPSGMGQPTTKPQVKSEDGEPENMDGYAFSPKTIEKNPTSMETSLVYDSPMRGNIEEANGLINENTLLLDTDDRTVPM